MKTDRSRHDADDHARTGPITVLLVDDDEQWARATARLLETRRETFTVETATSLAAAREQLPRLDPDCVVSDYRLGDGTGLDLLESVREIDPNRPFVLVTGRGSESIASEAIGGGVTDYIRKGRDDATGDLLAGRIANAVRTYRTERTLARERRNTDAMLDILTATTGRADLVEQFCSQLVEGLGYAFAWIGSTDSAGRLTPLASAGADGYLDAAEIRTRGEPDRDQRPAARALATDDPIVESSLAAGEDLDSEWRETASEYGFTAAAAVPIRHDGVRFGVLAVYATDSDAISARERRFLAEYAETVGYAVRTAELKRSLMADQPVTVDVAVADDAVPLVALAAGLDGDRRLEVRSALDRGDGSTLLLVALPDGGVADVADAAADLDSVAVRSVDPDPTPARCELLVEAPTPEAVLADHGGRFQQTVVEAGTATVTALLPDDGTVETVTQALHNQYDDAVVRTVWTDRTGRDEGVANGPLADLTDRQREVITYAYHHGYYDQPRGTTATALADSFDIARATLTQHLRTAERRIIGDSIER
jgi:predicted DNA binding protein/ActR/RegA family two-component response regulator